MFLCFVVLLLLVGALRCRRAEAARDIRLSCSRLMVTVDAARGFPRSVLLSERCEVKEGVWGDVETAARGAPPERLSSLPSRTHTQPLQAATTASGASFDYRVTRQASPQYIDEIYEITAKEDCVLETFALLFEPSVDSFRYHWYTGEDAGFALISQWGDPSVNLAMVLMGGKLRAFESPQGCQRLMLAYTDARRHPDSDEYPNPPVPLKAGESLHIHLRLFACRDRDDFETKWREMCGLPYYAYHRAVEVGKPWQLQIRALDRHKQVNASIQGKRLKSRRRGTGKAVIWDFETRPQKSGLQKVDITYEDGGQTRCQSALFYTMSPLAELLERRCQVVLSAQQDLEDAASPLYGGIFPFDFVARQRIAGKASTLTGGAGGMLASAILVLLKSHLTGRYEPREIRAVEIHAHQFVKGRLQQGGDDSFANPFRPYQAPYPEGSSYIAKEYLELSRVPARYLSLGDPEIYLLWAYRTLRYSLTRYPDALDRPYPTVIPEMVQHLEGMGYQREAELLRVDAQDYFERIAAVLKEPRPTPRQHPEPRIRQPERMLAGLLQWAKYTGQPVPARDWEIALLRVTGDIGYSYDPRLMAVFRQAGAESLRIQSPGLLTMPCPDTQAAGQALLEAYRVTGDEGCLWLAYQAMLSFYALYDADYAGNLWAGSLKPGEASSAYFPTLYHSDAAHDTLDGAAGAQDAGLMQYLLSFGQECYETRTGRVINGERARNRYSSYAPFPTRYFLKRGTVAIEPGAFIGWVEWPAPNALTLQLSGSGQRKLSVIGLTPETEYVFKTSNYHERAFSDAAGRLLISLQLGPESAEKIVEIFIHNPDDRSAAPLPVPVSLEERTQEFVLDSWKDQPPPPRRRRPSKKRRGGGEDRGSKGQPEKDPG
ncbi:MAG: hypothetical protein IT210_00735 [Armatimonadetes bacterium]|nr:hypothetical protein [Armatimonadota bacterium]